MNARGRLPASLLRVGLTDGLAGTLKGPRPKRPHMEHHEINVDQLRGKQVLDRAGNDLGSVQDVTIDPDEMRVTGFIVRVSREAADRLHLDRPVLGSAHIQVGADRLDTIGDSILLNIDQREMAGMLYDNRSS